MRGGCEPEFSGGDYFIQGLEDLGDVDLMDGEAAGWWGAWGLEDDFGGVEDGAGADGVGGAEDGDDGGAEGVCEVHAAGVVADDGLAVGEAFGEF